MPRRPVKYICTFTKSGVTHIDYKDGKLLAHYITYYRSIQSRYYTGVSLKMQKRLAVAIKRSRYMGMLPTVRYEK